jgi:hypothetical protein
VGLPDDLVQGLRPHPRRQRRLLGQLLLQGGIEQALGSGPL